MFRFSRRVKSASFVGALALAAVPVVAHPDEPTPTEPSSTDAESPALLVEETIHITATRVPEDILEVPAIVTVISGAEIEARGVRTLAGALALAHTSRDTVRGFLREDFDVPPDVSNADGYRQDFSGDDLYFDTHWALSPTDTLSVVTGLDLLAGKGKAKGENFEYHVALDGSGAPSSSSLPIDERPEMEDERAFAGAYIQALWKPAPRWGVDAGLRLNATHEEVEGEVEEDALPTASQDSRSDTRLSGGLGASYLAWGRGSSAVWVFADAQDTFKPAAVDFGPEAEREILEPETATTYELGLKGSHLGGRLDWQVSAYRMDFDNLVISQSVEGLPSLTNAGRERFEGVDLAARWHPLDALSVEGSYASHSAEFVDYLTQFDGEPTQLAGNTLEMSANRLASSGVTYSPTGASWPTPSATTSATGSSTSGTQRRQTHTPPSRLESATGSPPSRRASTPTTSPTSDRRLRRATSATRSTTAYRLARTVPA